MDHPDAGSLRAEGPLAPPFVTPDAMRELLAAIVESSNDAIVSKTPDGIIRSWNAAAERLFGFSAPGAIGRPISIIIPAERLPEEQVIMARLLRGERIAHFETIRQRSDGGLVDVSLTISPIADRQGRIIGASKIARDIGERRRADRALRESEERFRTLADNIAPFAWMADSTGWIFWYNQRWFDYTGTTLDEMQGWGWTRVHHPDHVARVVERIRHSWATGEPWEDTFPLRGRDGAYRWFLSRALPIRDGDGVIVRWFGTNTDITEQRQLEEHLRQLWVELTDANRRKDEFLATLSHELRNPLSAARSSLAVMAVARHDAAAVDRARAIADRQISQMARLLDDLLEISRIGSGKLWLTREQVDIQSVLRESIEAARPLFERSEIVLEAPTEGTAIPVSGDATRLIQVFGNLLTNAAKYTPPDGRVAVTVNRTGDSVHVSIRDTGAGIPPEMLDRVFELFAQVDARADAARGGLGIGLALVKRLVELHGGSVSAFSDGRGMGAEFVVRLPLYGGAAVVRTAAGEAELHAVGPRRVLIVDDERDNAESLSTLLLATGHHTSVAYDGVQALERAASFEPDVVLLDLDLPQLNGYEVCRQMRQRYSRPMLIVALTGRAQPDDIRRSEKAGFDRHLMKPIASTDLVDVLTGRPQGKASDRFGV